MRKVLLASAAAIPAVPAAQPQRSKEVQTARTTARPHERAARQQRTSRGARRGAPGGHEDAAGDDGDDGEGEVDPDASDDGEPDALVSDPQVCREFGVSAMTLWRWDRAPDVNFPPRVVIGRRNYRSRKALEKFKARLLRDAVARRAREARG